MQKAIIRCTPGLLLQQVVVGVFMQKGTHTVEAASALHHESLSTDTASVKTHGHDDHVQALGIGTRGDVYALSKGSAYVRNGAPSHTQAATAHSVVGKTHEVLLQLKEATASVKIIVVALLAIVALVGFCAMSVWLVWQPLNAIFEERAYEQAAKQALLDAAPPLAPAPGDAGARSMGSNVPFNQEQNAVNREEKLRLAWSNFLNNPLLAIPSSNLLNRLLHDLLAQPSFTTQLEDIFDGLKEEGASSIKREDLERACESVSGTLWNMHAKCSKLQVEYLQGAEIPMAVATVEDYSWIFDNFVTVFPTDMPVDKKSFAGVISLVVAWSCVRTLHTARHMRIEHHQRSSTTASAMSEKVAIDIKIDMSSGPQSQQFPLEARAELLLDAGVLAANEAEKDSSSEDDKAKNDGVGSPSEDKQQEDAAP